MYIRFRVTDSRILYKNPIRIVRPEFTQVSNFGVYTSIEVRKSDLMKLRSSIDMRRCLAVVGRPYPYTPLAWIAYSHGKSCR